MEQRPQHPPEGSPRGDQATTRFADLGTRKWMGVYLRLLAIGYAFSALVHYGNLLGLGELPFSEMPLSWKLGDIGYALLDTVAVVGLWRRADWGIACFLLAAVSQLILYVGFPSVFAFTPAQQAAIQGLVITHVVTLLIFFVLWAIKK